jgi:hypothetical protein
MVSARTRIVAIPAAVLVLAGCASTGPSTELPAGPPTASVASATPKGSLAQATTGAAASGSASASVLNPPPPPTVSVAWAGRAPLSVCGGDASCTYFTISWANFSAGSHTVTPRFDGQKNWCGTACANDVSRSGSSGDYGSYWAAGYCTSTHYVTADVDGVLSNVVKTKDHGC